jgi:Holliday junction DNA helicase RuvB
MKFIEVGAKLLDKLDEHLLPVAGYTNSNSRCTSCKADNENEQLHYSTIQDIKPFAINNKDSIFGEIIGYSDIKKEFAKALDSSSPVSILLCGPPGCGKSEFLKQIGEHFEDESLFIDGSYGSKAGIFEILHKNRPKYVLFDEIDKLSGQDQQALLNLMESGRLTKTTKSDSYDIKLDVWVFATANNEEKILEPLFDRFETYFLAEYTDDEFRGIAVNRLRQEGIENEELAVYIANGVLRGRNRKNVRDAIRIARKSKTIQDVDETVQTLNKYNMK